MITFYIPTTEDLWFREKLLGDAETMSYNHAWGGTIDFPPSRWTQWHRKWIDDQNSHYFYRYLCAEGEFVGEAAYHFEEERGIWLTDVLIYAPFRGRGYGKEALLLLCETAQSSGIRELCDDIALDNLAAGLFLQCGFEEAFRTGTYVLLRKRLTP